MKEQLKDIVLIRTATPSDENLIFSTWLKGLYYGNDWFREIPQDLYYENYHKVVTAIIAKPSTCVIVACMKEDADTVLGYSVWEKREEKYVLHWVFTKPVWRKLGLAKSLIPKEVSLVTHLTKVGRSIKPKEWVFDPFLS
jgi:hypothetical protein